jgi:glycerol-3-phosphate dehydrogenase
MTCHFHVPAAPDRYAEDKRRAREQYEAIGELLNAQVASNSQRNAEEAAQQQQEIDALKARWAADDEAARQAEDSARARQQQLNLEVKEFNRCCTKHDKSLRLVLGLY